MKNNLTQVKSFFDPHPGFGGAAVPLPPPIKEAADNLNGQKMSLEDALEKIKGVVRKLFPKGGWDVEVKEKSWVALTIHENGGWSKGGRTHMWCLIKFK